MLHLIACWWLIVPIASFVAPLIAKSCLNGLGEIHKIKCPHCLFSGANRFRSATFEITSTDVGKFEISGKFLGIEVQRVELVFQVSIGDVVD